MGQYSLKGFGTLEALYEFGGTILWHEDIYKEEKKKREKKKL